MEPEQEAIDEAPVVEGMVTAVATSGGGEAVATVLGPTEPTDNESVVVATVVAEPEEGAPAEAAAAEASSGGRGAKRPRRSGVKVPRWNEEEEELLKRLVMELGDKAWPECAARLGTNRSGAGVEQHWQIMTGRRKRNGKPEVEKAAPVPAIAYRPTAPLASNSPHVSAPTAFDPSQEGKKPRENALVTRVEEPHPRTVQHVFTGEQMSCGTITVDVGSELPWHANDNAEGLLYCVSGHGNLTIGVEADPTSLMAGTIALVPKGAVHRVLNTSAREQLVFVYAHAPIQKPEQFAPELEANQREGPPPRAEAVATVAAVATIAEVAVAEATVAEATVAEATVAVAEATVATAGNGVNPAGGTVELS